MSVLATARYSRRAGLGRTDLAWIALRVHVPKAQLMSGPIEGPCDEAGLGRWIALLLLIKPVGGENAPVRQLNRAGISQVMSPPSLRRMIYVLDIPSLAPSLLIDARTP